MKLDYRDRDREILQEALRKLQDQIPVGNYDIEWDVATEKGTRFDAVLRFEKILNDYAVEIRRNLNPYMLEALEFNMKTNENKAILVTHEVTQPIAKELRERNIRFIDTLGNMFLFQNEPYINVYITDHKPKKQIAVKQLNAFTWARLQVILTLLAKEDAIDLTYREIAYLAGVALGTVSWTINDLRQLGYIRKYKHKLKIMNKEKLVFKWLEEYPAKIRPKLNPRRFDVQDRYWWIQTDLERYGAVLGGETAAGVITKYLHPEKGVLYVQGEINELAIALRLKANPNGSLTIMDKFWKCGNLLVNEVPVAPPIIVCAELLAEGGERNRETADLIMKDLHVV